MRCSMFQYAQQSIQNENNINFYHLNSMKQTTNIMDSNVQNEISLTLNDHLNCRIVYYKKMCKATQIVFKCVFNVNTEYTDMKCETAQIESTVQGNKHIVILYCTEYTPNLVINHMLNEFLL